MRVLVLDSDLFACKLLDLSIRKSGHECLCVHSGEAALAALKKDAYCLVFISLVLADGDGVAVAGMIRSGAAGFLPTKIPIIAMTLEEINFEHIRGKGFTNYLRKPFLCKDIDVTLKTICANRDHGVDGLRSSCPSKCYLL